MLYFKPQQALPVPRTLISGMILDNVDGASVQVQQYNIRPVQNIIGKTYIVQARPSSVP